MSPRMRLFDVVPRSVRISEDVRREVNIRVFMSRGAQKRMMVAGIISMIIGLPLAALIVGLFIAFHEWIGGVSTPPVLFGALNAIAIMLTFWFVNRLIARRLFARNVQETLQTMGLEQCRKCGYALTGLNDFVKQCPECGADRRPMVCRECGHVLKPIGSEDLRCPECGSRQRTIDEPARQLWMQFRQVDPVIELLPRSVLQSLRVAARQQCMGKALIILSLAACLVAMIWGIIPFVEFNSTLPAIMLGALLFPVIWVAPAKFWHATYGASFRRQTRRIGYDVCQACGWWFGDEFRQTTCRQCGADHQALDAPAPARPGLPDSSEMRRLADTYAELLLRPDAALRRKGIIVPAILGITLLAVTGLIIWFADGLSMFGWIALCSLGGMVLSHFLRRRWMREGVFSQLRWQGVELCAQCGYWLRGLGDEVTKCPECGAERGSMGRAETST